MPAQSQPTATKHDAQTLKLEVMEQKNRLILVERTVNSLGEAMTGMDAKIDTIVNALTGITTRQELHRPTDWMKVLGAAGIAVTLFTAATGGITYIVNAVNGGQVTAMRKDIDFLERRIDRGWGVVTTDMQIRVKPPTGMPQ